tara:strand:+ start:41 stop:517 length:477 start_codon:yes stop_codon:yes gene_type:complete
MKKSNIGLIFGRICSGKSSFQSQSYRIIVSNIVKDLMGSTDREKLQDSMHLDAVIGDEIVKCLGALTYLIDRDLLPLKNIIVDGIRQPEIVERVLGAFPDANLVWLEVPEEKRKKRYELRNDGKDTQPFYIADNQPIELECQKIFSIFNKQLQVINNY